MESLDNVFELHCLGFKRNILELLFFGLNEKVYFLIRALPSKVQESNLIPIWADDRTFDTTKRIVRLLGYQAQIWKIYLFFFFFFSFFKYMVLIQPLEIAVPILSFPLHYVTKIRMTSPFTCENY